MKRNKKRVVAAVVAICALAAGGAAFTDVNGSPRTPLAGFHQTQSAAPRPACSVEHSALTVSTSINVVMHLTTAGTTALTERGPSRSRMVRPPAPPPRRARAPGWRRRHRVDVHLHAQHCHRPGRERIQRLDHRLHRREGQLVVSSCFGYAVGSAHVSVALPAAPQDREMSRHREATRLRSSCLPRRSDRPRRRVLVFRPHRASADLRATSPPAGRVWSPGSTPGTWASSGPPAATRSARSSPTGAPSSIRWCCTASMRSTATPISSREITTISSIPRTPRLRTARQAVDTRPARGVWFNRLHSPAGVAIIARCRSIPVVRRGRAEAPATQARPEGCAGIALFEECRS